MPIEQDLADIKRQLAELTALMMARQAEATRTEIGPKPPERQVYSIDQAAESSGLSVHTIRHYCRMGRINALKREGWRSGPHERWVIPAAEVERMSGGCGLLPVDVSRNRGRRFSGRGGAQD